MDDLAWRREVHMVVRTWAIARKEMCKVSLSEAQLSPQERRRNFLARQKAYGEASAKLLELMNQCTDYDKLPAALARFFRAVKDSGCTSCWITHNPMSRHPECQKKLSEYRLAANLLEDYGLKLKDGL